MFISNAYAETAAAAPQGGIMEFLPLIALLAVFYFLVLRPQQKRAKEHKQMTEGLQKGDEVLTVGGVTGSVSRVFEDYILLQVADGVELNVQKLAIQNVLPKGTLKSIK